MTAQRHHDHAAVGDGEPHALFVEVEPDTCAGGVLNAVLEDGAPNVRAGTDADGVEQDRFFDHGSALDHRLHSEDRSGHRCVTKRGSPGRDDVPCMSRGEIHAYGEVAVERADVAPVARSSRSVAEGERMDASTAPDDCGNDVLAE